MVNRKWKPRVDPDDSLLFTIHDSRKNTVKHIVTIAPASQEQLHQAITSGIVTGVAVFKEFAQHGGCVTARMQRETEHQHIAAVEFPIEVDHAHAQRATIGLEAKSY